MKKTTRRLFFRDAAAILLLPATTSLVSATLDDILGMDHAQAQDLPGIREQLSFTIGLRNYATNTILGRIDNADVGRASLDVHHTATHYSLWIGANIDIHGSWVRMQTNLRGQYSYEDGQPQFRPQHYWLRYQEGGSGTTPKTFLAYIHFDFPTYTARSYGYHEQQGRQTLRYGSADSRVESRFHPSTRDLFSAMMEARFLPAQPQRQINTIVEGRPRALWLEHMGYERFQPERTAGYLTRRFRLHFPMGILPDTSWDLYLYIHNAQDRTPLRATLRKSDGSQILFTLREPASSIPRDSLYRAP